MPYAGNVVCKRNFVFFVMSVPIFPHGIYPASILYKSTAGHYRPVSYPDGPITARCRFIKNAYWVGVQGLTLLTDITYSRNRG